MVHKTSMDLDRIDAAILTHLQREGRLTAAELGDRVGLSASACHRRVKALEEAGVIDRYVALLSEDALGRRSTVFVAVTLDAQRREVLEAFELAVAGCPEVMDCFLMSGDSDYLLRVSVAAGDSYERIHKDVLSALPGVRRLVSNFAIRRVVSRTAVPVGLR
jgi:Lrp/AsnC family transcriptional regulator, leucine-responsive regulatory protein